MVPKESKREMDTAAYVSRVHTYDVYHKSMS